MTDQSPDDEVVVSVRGGLGHLLLNRPRAINALNHGMVGLLSTALDTWAHDDRVRTVVLSGAGERGLCAGGDIVAIYRSIVDGTDDAARFWSDEYTLDAAISRYPKPYVAIMDGLVLGGGIGLSAHGGIRVVTERTRVGMPEVSIGFFPDVGGTHLLARAPGELGTHLALTGGNADGADAIVLGLADHFVRSERLPDLLIALESREAGEVLSEFAETPPASGLAAQRSWIDVAYAGDDASVILQRLDTSSEAEARSAADAIRTKSPTSVAVTLEALRRASQLPDLEAALAQDARLAAHFTGGHDMREGIRAQVIDKDRNPGWEPATLADVTPEQIAAYFSPSTRSRT